MLDKDNVLRLQQLIELERQKSSTILGALIGDIVKENFSGLRVKSEYGSIRKLIEQHLSQSLVFHSKHGKDNEYAFVQDMSVLPNGQDVTEEIPHSQNKLNENKGEGRNGQSSVVLRDSLKDEPKHQFGSDEILRQAIMASIAMMSPDQLRQLVIPAGILFDAINKTPRV